MENIKQEAERIIDLFKKVTYYDKDLMSMQTVYCEKLRAIECAKRCIDEMITVCDVETDNLEQLHKVKQYIIDNY